MSAASKLYVPPRILSNVMFYLSRAGSHDGPSDAECTLIAERHDALDDSKTIAALILDQRQRRQTEAIDGIGTAPVPRNATTAAPASRVQRDIDRGAPPARPLRVTGVGAIQTGDRSAIIYLTDSPSAADCRALHDFLRGWTRP